MFCKLASTHVCIFQLCSPECFLHIELAVEQDAERHDVSGEAEDGGDWEEVELHQLSGYLHLSSRTESPRKLSEGVDL